MECQISIGNFIQFGPVKKGKKTTFTFTVQTKGEVILHFYSSEESREEVCSVPIPADFRRGKVYSVEVQMEHIERFLYLIEEDGVLRMDPCAKKVVGRETFGDLTRLEKTPSVFSAIPKESYSWRGDEFPRIPDQDLLLYRLHLRGFAMEPGISKNKKGNYLGVIGRLPMLRDLGVNVLEFQPLYEFEELLMSSRDSTEVEKINFWGYGAGDYFAPKAAYFGGKDSEVHMKDLVRSIHRYGMECIMEFWFPSDVPADLILDALRFWHEEYHVDGFRVMGESLPIHRISEDPYLADVRIFCDGIPEDILWKENASFRHLYQQNADFLYPLRRLQNHKEGSIIEFSNMMKRQNESYGFVNFAASSDGFSLADAYSYSEKHNEANGEDNRDGLNFNYTHNFGVEGESNSRNVRTERLRHMRTALAAVLLSQSIPMIQAGDTLGNTQFGNNNPYCQDNETGWVTFSKKKDFRDLNQYTKKLIQFRKSHPIIHMLHPMQMNDSKHMGYPDLSYHGREPWTIWLSEDLKSIGMFYNGAYGENPEEEDVMLCFNFYFAEENFQLPKARPGRRWRYVTNTAAADWKDVPEALEDQCLTVPGGSLTILIGSDETEEEQILRKKTEKIEIDKTNGTRKKS